MAQGLDSFEETVVHDALESVTHSRNSYGPNFPADVLTVDKIRRASLLRPGFHLWSAFEWLWQISSGDLQFDDVWTPAEQWYPADYFYDSDGTERRWLKMDVEYSYTDTYSGSIWYPSGNRHYWAKKNQFTGHVLPSDGTHWIAHVAIVNAGSEYIVGQSVTIDGGTLVAGHYAPTFEILEVNSSGGVTKIAPATGDMHDRAYTVSPSTPNSVTGGGGEGLTIALTMEDGDGGDVNNAYPWFLRPDQITSTDFSATDTYSTDGKITFVFTEQVVSEYGTTTLTITIKLSEPLTAASVIYDAWENLYPLLPAWGSIARPHWDTGYWHVYPVDLTRDGSGIVVNGINWNTSLYPFGAAEELVPRVGYLGEKAEVADVGTLWTSVHGPTAYGFCGKVITLISAAAWELVTVTLDELGTQQSVSAASQSAHANKILTIDADGSLAYVYPHTSLYPP